MEGLPEAEAAICWYFRREWLAQAPRLQWVATPAAGSDWIDLPPDSTITVHHGGFHGMMMAESVLGAMLYFCKAFEASYAFQKQKKWARIKLSQQITSLYRARVTILGFGRIGQTIGRVLKPFGSRVTGVRRRTDERPDYFDESDRVVSVDHLNEVLPETDHLVLVLPGGDETDGLLTADHFSQLPAHCHLYNVGRGNPYREEDLARALETRQIAGAYLDVFDEEPLPESSPLWNFDNVLIQPHLSAASPQYLDLFIQELIGKLKI
ncbi:D-2-hydroxyacid dehydrogenase [Nitrospina gracilis]|uniref:D-2-hydroxyacid dehydrogenase n=1 Tax=Nitrospina gracilis TaxID=35801 RepID=UPI001F3BFE82|nr:D-2-hydroxyacid dehydrogenase [Nitrospina gracilis]MCF8720095.1 phosphoglycerate dehydrogenase-like enzyme [Nitrospina gracilis Nb-211]